MQIPPPCSPPPSPDSSDLSSLLILPFSIPPHSSSIAAIHEAVSSKPPILHAGEYTPAIICEFKLAFAHYCTIKEIAEEKQTKTLIRCFHDHRITNIISDLEECKTLLVGTVSKFMKQICSIDL
ncbi:hypothetical protein DFH08DRAFT_951458 [Mycena albidolilacea]|uniref:Uncharacterized protein n=1 Tax=Mycena albidolilacea TaxID=1033008 RepID=A0AAD7AKQ5_9AGAR|nr:hypothetical protein DFH08DRAFT_951458 [Mycena albidolilacea]